MKMNQLLKRIERLEQAVGEIRSSCPCVSELEEPEQECPGSICPDCDQAGSCLCDDWPEEQEDPEPEEGGSCEKDHDH